MKLCTKVGMTRANYYKRKRRRREREIDEGLVISLVNWERRDHPGIGGRKLYKMLKPELEEAGVQIGRDRLFQVLREHGLLVQRLPKAPRTTDSRHCLRTAIRSITRTGVVSTAAMST